MDRIECRVFKLDVGWGYGLFHFPLGIDGLAVRNNPQTKQITKNDYVGTYEFDKEYFSAMETKKIHDIDFYFVYFMTKD